MTWAEWIVVGGIAYAVLALSVGRILNWKWHPDRGEENDAASRK